MEAEKSVEIVTKRERIFLLIIALVTVLIYIYGFRGAFAYDDYSQIVNRPKIQNIFN